MLRTANHSRRLTRNSHSIKIMPQISLHSPVGDLSLSEDEGSIVALDWGWGRDQSPTPLLKEAAAQLNAYFDGRLKIFNLPLRPFGTDFQRSVWRAMCKIPYGKIRTYGDLAGRLKSGARPVGTACGRNPIPIIIPCHRVVGMTGLGGYSGDGGLDTKLALLTLEDAPTTFKPNKKRG
jgi:methylated-DNA-[protein]-cysteine S-methyltransferase